MTPRPLVLALLVLALVACREGVKRRFVTATGEAPAPSAPAAETAAPPAKALPPAGALQRVEYYQISDG